MEPPKRRKRNLQTAGQPAEQQPAGGRRPVSWLRRIAGWLFWPFKTAFRWLNQPVRTHADYSDNAWMSALTRQRSMVPPYVRQSATELRMVSWPSFPAAMRMTTAVFFFAVFFALVVAGLDWVLTQIFEEIILNKAENLRNLF